MRLLRNREYRLSGLVLLSSVWLSFVSSAWCAGTPQDAIISSTNQASAMQLRAAVQGDGEGLFLDQLFATGRDLPRLRLADSPGFGKSVLLRRAELAELAHAAGFEQPLTNWTGAEAVRISRRSRALDERETLQLLTSVLQKQYVKDIGELELRLTRAWTSMSVPDEAFTLRVLDIPTSGVAPAFIARFELETAYGEHIGSWQASLQAKVWREVSVAGSVLKRGEALKGADIVRERRDMLVCREPLADLASADDSLEFSESVQAGSPILARVLRHRAIVHRGQSLAATLQDGALMITLKVEALEDGAAGQIIRVRNPLSRRDLHGKVIDEQNILVFL